MSLRHALLALVSGGPLTGYDAVKHFRSSVGHLWHAPDSQIYPELRRMQAEGELSDEELAETAAEVAALAVQIALGEEDVPEFLPTEE